MVGEVPGGDLAATEIYLFKLWEELMAKRAELAALGTLDLQGFGTSAGNHGNLRITRQNFHAALHDDQVTWLLTARLKMAEVAVVEDSDRPAMRRGLIALAATVLAWIEEIDSE